MKRSVRIEHRVGLLVSARAEAIGQESCYCLFEGSSIHSGLVEWARLWEGPYSVPPRWVV